METKQQSQATTIENLKSETGWEFTVLLIKKKSVCMFSNLNGIPERRKTILHSLDRESEVFCNHLIDEFLSVKL